MPKNMHEIEGKIIAQKILDRARDRAVRIRVKPSLAVILVGNDPASAQYVQRKSRAAEYVGVRVDVHLFPKTVTTQELVTSVKNLQVRSDALIVQLPLPKQVDVRQVLDAVSPNKDADCLSSESIGRVMRGQPGLLPPTAAAIMEILQVNKIKLNGQHVVVVGQGELVGKPITAMLINEPVTLTVCGLGTKNLADFTKQADILITGTGKPGLIKKGMIKKGAVVIDAGSGQVKNKIMGDVDLAALKVAKIATPVPGGVGPVTVAKLIYNVVLLADQ